MTDEEGTRTMTPRILAFAGSLRRESFNKKLVPIAAKGARDAGAEVTTVKGANGLPFSRLASPGGVL
jgi:NAD(P)H-dependent FMN reductase